MTAKDHVYTLGIEEEFAIVDPQTRELRSHIQAILEGGKVLLKEQVKPEMHQSVVELGTEICQSVIDAREHVIELRSKLASLAGQAGLKIASTGTHPFRIGATNSLPKASATKKSLKTCSSSRAPT